VGRGAAQLTMSTCCFFVVEQNLVKISTISCLDVFFRRLGIHMMRLGSLCKNMTSSTKPEVHNISEHCQRDIEPGIQATCKKLVKFCVMVFELFERTDRQTDRHTHHNFRTPRRGEVTNRTNGA